jgi:hypothetical protein
MIILALVLAVLLIQPCATAQDKPLAGHVKKEGGTTRIIRPGTPLNAKTAAGRAAGAIQSNDFSIGAEKMGGTSQMHMPELPQSTPVTVAPPSFSSGAGKSLLPANTNTTPAPSGNADQPSSNSGGGSGSAPNYDYGFRPRSDKKVVIRLKRFRASQEMEIVWEASRRANRMLKKGADVTIILDMDAVHAADRNDTAFAEIEENRGNGNRAAERLTSPQHNMFLFVQNGGNLVASARWAKLFAISNTALIPGIKLLTDDELDDILLEPNVTVLDF